MACLAHDHHVLRSASNYTHHIDHTANFSMICVVLLNTLDNMVIPELGKIRGRRDPRFAEQTIHVGRVNEERGWNRVVPVLRYSLRFKEGDEKRAHCGGTTTCLCVPPLLDDTVAIHERKALDVPFVRLRLLVLIRGGRPESPEFHGIVA